MRSTNFFCLIAAIFTVQLLAVSRSCAEGLFGIVSERNSATMAAAAERFKESYPAKKVSLRTPRQISLLSDAEITSRIINSDVFFVAGVFGEEADRLARLIGSSGKTENIFIVSSTRDLVALSRDAVTGAKASRWHLINAYWQARGVENTSNLIAALLKPTGLSEIPPPNPLPPVRFAESIGPANAPLIALVDYDTGDQAGNVDLHEALCRELVSSGASCLSVYADWGAASVEALRRLLEKNVSGIVLLQDFAIGGSQQIPAEEALLELGVPVLKGIRLTEFEEAQWRSSVDGLPTDSVYYRVAMPELVGASQPMVLAVGTEPTVHPATGIEVRMTRPVPSEVQSIVSRLIRWTALRRTGNEDKRLAIIYYNHPPGRHNIGADNLDVPASLFRILEQLRRDGYDVGELPESEAALLDLILEKAVNLPEDGAALAEMAKSVFSLPAASYRQWFATLPELTRSEVSDGPLAALRIRIRDAIDQRDADKAGILLADAVHDMAFVIEGGPARYRARAEDLLDQLEAGYKSLIQGEDQWPVINSLSRALMNQGIAGLQGWGEPPGIVMTHAGEFVFPGLQFGKILLAPQPPRGWEVYEEVLHANMSVPPTHQYLAFYRWLQSEFEPHAIVHLGRHSTYEFLPGKRVGLQDTDYSRLIAGDIPGLYPYIVDGVGEGIQAKRRGLAVIVDHLTPPLQATPFYDELLGLRQLVESFESADPSQAGDAARARALNRIKTLVVELGLKDALIAERQAEQGRDETIEFETISADLLIHEVGHYLTEVQEDFMPLGLHVFGQPWSEEALDTMLASMRSPESRSVLQNSPSLEMQALMQGLNGRFVRPGKGNDPLRSPDALPTGRNFYGLDASLIPNVIAWDIGAAMAVGRPETADNPAVVLWASDTVRDGGVMIAFGLRLMGVKPVWNGRGIVTGLERLKTSRQDVSFVASGLFRDLYGEQLKWLDKAVLLSLDGAADTIRKKFPELKPSLEEALLPLGELRAPGQESLADNRIAASWVSAMLEKASLAKGDGRSASLRLFAPAPGRYGAGINRLAERSGAWNDRQELARSYIARMGHAYGVGINGQARQDAFVDRLASVGSSFLGRASNLYGLVDNNDAFDYLGGLNMAVESVRGQPANGFVIDVSNPERPVTSPLASAIAQELRARQLNPHWIKSLMPHGYAGARTMSSAFFENLWGWETTDPDLFPDTIWDDAKSIYIDDRYNLGLETFFREAGRKPVKANILAILLVAAQKNYWQADDETIRQLAGEFANVVIEAGLPGSGHTRPDHPMLHWIDNYLPPETAAQLTRIRDSAGDASSATKLPETIRELHPVEGSPSRSVPTIWPAFTLTVTLLGVGFLLGRRSAV